MINWRLPRVIRLALISSPQTIRIGSSISQVGVLEMEDEPAPISVIYTNGLQRWIELSRMCRINNRVFLGTEETLNEQLPLIVQMLYG